MGSLFSDESLFLIAGPCVVESDELNLRVAEELARVAELLPGGVIYKASFDKANRSGAAAHRGPGMDAGLRALELVRSRSGLPVITDVHLPDQCAPTAAVVDALQIPAFLCRQTDLLRAAGQTGRPVNIKKGQWMHPSGMAGAVAKVLAAAPGDGSSVAVTERGTFFGYGDLVVDMRNFSALRQACGVPVIFDATHSVQKPGLGADGSSGGAREHISALASAAVAAGANGVFIETHPDPERAPSDGSNMLPLAQLRGMVESLVRIWLARRA